MVFTILLPKHKTQKAIGVFLLGVLFPVFLASQQLTLSRQVILKTIIKKNIKVLHEDRYGFMWMGGGGLYKFDGYTPKVYHPLKEDSLSVSMGVVYDLLESKEGNLWIAANGGLFFYDRKTDEVRKVFTDHIERIFPTTQRIFTLFEDSQSRIWIGGETGLALMTLGQDTTFQLLHRIKNKGEQHSEGVRSVREDSKGNIWVATSEGLWAINSNLTIQHYEPEIQDRKRKMSFRIIDSELSKGDTLWLATAEHLWLFDTQNKAFSKISLPAYDDSAVRELLLDENNHLWIATRNNILVRYPNSNFRWIAGYPSYQLGGINTLLKDRFGNLWAGSNGKVSYLNLVFDRMLPHYQISNGPPAQDNAIYRVAEDSSGGFWFRLLRSGLGYSPHLGGNFEILLNPPNNLFLDEIKDLCVDIEGNVWAITLTNGLYCFEKGSKNYRQFDFGDSLKVGAPRSVKADVDNGQLLWISTKFGLCALNRKTSQRSWYSPKKDLPWLENSTVGQIEVGPDGNIWGFLRVKSKWIIGYFDKEARRYRADSTMVNHLSSTRIFPIKRVNKEEVWAGTNGGLIIIDTNKKHKPIYPKKMIYPSAWLIALHQMQKVMYGLIQVLNYASTMGPF